MDTFIYLYNPIGTGCSHLYLARVMPSEVNDQSQYQYVTSGGGTTNPSWSSVSSAQMRQPNALSPILTLQDDFNTGNDAFSIAPVRARIDGSIKTEYAMVYQPYGGPFGGEVVVRLGPHPWGPFSTPDTAGDDYGSDLAQGVYVAGMRIDGCYVALAKDQSRNFDTCRDFVIHPDMGPSAGSSTDGSYLVMSYFHDLALVPNGVPDGYVQFGKIPVACIIDVHSTQCTPHGYWEVSSDGSVLPIGTNFPSYGSVVGLSLAQPIVGIAKTRDARGYWLIAADGGVFAFGDAVFYGSTGGQKLQEPIVGLVPTFDSRGYWLIAADGGVFAFGDAGYFGSLGGQPLNKPVVAMAATPDNNGYWLAAADGGVFSFGDAPYLGGASSIPLVRPIVSMVATPEGQGYLLIAGDGGVFSFGITPQVHPTFVNSRSNSVVGAAMASDGAGGYVAAADATVYNSFGSEPFYGPNQPYGVHIVGIAAS